MSEYPATRTDPTRTRTGGYAGPHGARHVYVGVVHTRGTICHICAAATRERLAVRLAEYVGENATCQLWPADAERVRGLLAAGRAQAAVDLYFAAVGQRWAREELSVQRTGVGVEA